MTLDELLSKIPDGYNICLNQADPDQAECYDHWEGSWFCNINPNGNETTNDLSLTYEDGSTQVLSEASQTMANYEAFGDTAVEAVSRAYDALVLATF